MTEIVAKPIEDIVPRKSSFLLRLVSFPGIVHRSLALLIGVLLLSESVAATPGRMGVSIAQQPATTEQEATRVAAERAFQEGFQLYEQGTAESLRQAITKLNDALPLYQAVGDKKGEAVTLLVIGKIYDDLGEKQKALEFYNQSLPLSRATGHKAGEGVTLNNIGAVYEALGEKQKALDFYNQSLPLSRATGDKAVTLNNIGRVYDALGEKEKALDYLNQSLPLSRATGDKAIEAFTLNYIGVVYSALGENQKALDFYNQSLPLSRATGDKVGEARTLNNIGAVYSALGEKQTALDFYNQSLPLRRATGDKAGVAVTLNNIGLVYADLGEKQTALDFYNQSLPLRRATGDKAGEARTLNGVAEVYGDLGEKQKALDYLNQSLPLSRATGDKATEAVTLNNIGAVYLALGEKQKALEFYNQSLPLKRATGDKAAEARTLTNIGRVYADLGEKQKALEFYNQSLPLSRATGDKAAEAVTLNNIGRFYADLGEKQKALEFYNQSLPLSRAIRAKATEAVTLYNFAYLERNRGNLNEAFTQMEAAIKIIEKLRTNIASQQFRASYFASVQNYYQFYIDLLMQLHKQQPSKGYDSLALNVSERAKARNLLELLTEANVNIRSRGDSKLIKQERTLQQQLNAAEQSRVKLLEGSYNNKQLAEIKKQIESLLSELDRVQAEVRVKNPAYAAISQPGAFTLNLQQIQQQVLDDNTLLLEYSLGSDRSYLWAVTKTGITSYELPKRADIEAAAKEFYNQLKSETGSLESGMKLSQILLSPVANQLTNKRLLIVSDGALQSIPFAALPIPTGTSPPTPSLQGEGSNSPAPPSLQGKGAGGLGFTPLLVQNEIVSLPSASTLGVLRSQLKGRKPAAKTVAVLADPIFTSDDKRLTSKPQQSNTTIASDAKRSAEEACRTSDLERLEYSSKEAEQILKLVPASQHLQALGSKASHATATSPDLAQYRMVHFATHGCVNEEQPQLSGLVLSLFDDKGNPTDNGFLRLHDIYNLNLPAELVVLSACETGLGKDVKGEGLIGLTRGFMYAGAKRVAVSLWRVNDVATSKLMEKYYQQMLDKGLNPVAALRAAQLEMWQTEQWKAPYYWAAFVVQGEWR
ncbi:MULTISPECIES: CHAT domain-containing protein [Cyanophyceae]|uniref:CHAT domain-containing protein n=1 Tax=Cyanophyceae TaxID=3028117 RepID=UPI0016874895|nr:CHAT domain-containing tetratricopeptide repeat protein [Trichocoleus sp. FACHB-69]MBD1931978.1 CHAT domain-containing protein [Trichocoleus sp. FACHB-69]